MRVKYGFNLSKSDKIVRSMFDFPKFIFSVLVGIMLSDGRIGNPKGHMRLEIDQSLSKFKFLSRSGEMFFQYLVHFVKPFLELQKEKV